MSSALLAVPAILVPLQTLWRWLMPALPSLSGRPTTLHGHAKPSHQPWHHNELTWRAEDNQRPGTGKRTTPSHASAHRPLRIVRVMEAGQASAQVGRMVISGRMADVCAELDRLAACEAALY